MEQEPNMVTGANAGLTRQPGRRGGCSCCGFTMLSILAAPLVAIALLFVVL